MEPTPDPKKKTNLASIVGMIVGAGAIILVQQFFFKTPSYDEAMVRGASEINKTCPMMVDDETRLDNAAALPNNVFQYNYTLVNFEKATTDVADLEEKVRPSIIGSVKTNPSMKPQRDHGTTLQYTYKDKNGEFLFKVDVTPDLYKE